MDGRFDSGHTGIALKYRLSNPCDPLPIRAIRVTAVTLPLPICQFFPNPSEKMAGKSAWHEV